MKLCECDCGQPAPIATHTRSERGQIKGQPVRFISGHNVAIKDHVALFWTYVDKANGPVHPVLGTRCWLWTGADDGNGYGSLRFDGRTQKASRVVWYITHDKWPDNFACHKCDNPPCVNPDHLFDGTGKDNAEDSVAKGRREQGEQRYNAKLLPFQVLEIRKKYTTGKTTMKALSSEYGVHVITVFDIISRKTWKHLLKEKA